MNKKRIILFVFLLLVIVSASVAYYMWNKPHRSVESEKGMTIAAKQLFNEYTSDEKAADQKYLNKALEVSGQVSVVDKNQDGHPYLILQTDDLMNGVMCTLRDADASAVPGNNIIVKGFCSGFVGDVKLTDCIIMNTTK